VDIEKIKELMRAMEETELNSLALTQDGFELVLERKNFDFTSPLPQHSHTHTYAEEAPKSTQHIVKTSLPSSSNPPAQAVNDDLFVTSPMVGTYFEAVAPGEPSFVKVGDPVDENTVVCIVEAMKVMNEVKAGIKGVVVEVMAENGHPVEFGSKLIRIDPV
jgi:acetyl-CoA carboxylase biotin carboxyl carrier protein